MNDEQNEQNEIDEPAVESFVAGAREGTASEIRQVIARLLDMELDREPHARWQGRPANTATLHETRERLARLLYERGEGCFLCSFGAAARQTACAHA